MSRLIDVRCDACGKAIRQREWMEVTVSGNYGEPVTFDVCKDCRDLMDKAISIGLRLATDGNGRRLTVIAEGDGE